MNASRNMASISKSRRKVLGISGSPRKGGNSDVLLESILAGVSRESLPSTPLYLRDIRFRGCIGCEKCREDKICTGLNDGMSRVYDEVITSRGMILVSPAHNHNVTAWMKAYIDRLYCFYDYDNQRPRNWASRLANQNRKAVIAAICGQEKKEDMGFTMEAMRYPIQALGYEIVAELPVFGIFDRGMVRENRGVIESAKKLGVNLARALED